jgi:hypothetical protein
MFSCHLCGRAYATQNSLTRHSHNHGKDKSHACTECHVVFSRRDLLVRHSKIHAASNNVERPGGRRLRCHTACVNCRRSRTRCDGDGTKPCTSCSNTNKECTFSVTSHRVSEDIRIKDHDNSHYDSTPTEDGAGHPSPLDESFDFSAVLPSSDMAQPSGNIDEDGFQTVFDPTSFSPMQMTAWPWLHEDLFFQNETPNNWHQPIIDDPRNGDNAVHSMLLDNISGPGVSMSSQSAADNFAQDLLSHAVSEDIPRHLPENETIQPMGQRNSNFPTHKNRTFSHGKLSKYCHLFGRRKLTLGSKAAQSNVVAPAFTQHESDHNFTTQTAIVEELIAYARATSLKPQPQRTPSAYWRSISVRVQRGFHLSSMQDLGNVTDHSLDNFVKLYQDNFSHLWPFFARHTFDPSQLHPVLYLTLGSIGSMYGGNESSQYGSLMHEHLRDFLAESLFDFQHTDNDCVSLAQARSLTQVAALYFGHKRAFSYAQHLGSILISQARRMDLFSPPKSPKWLLSTPELNSDSSANAEWLSRWVRAETRKRLAYSILRLEVYTSVLLNTRPLLSSEELQLELPCSPFLWLTKFPSDSQFIAAIQQDAASSNREKVLFCDLVRLAMDRDEHPPSFDVISVELLLFGLQHHVWRLCHDVEALVRLIGMQISPDLPFNGLDMEASPNSRVPLIRGRNLIGIDRSQVRSSREQFEDHLLQRFRHMDDLRADQGRTFFALRKWRQMFNAVCSRQLTTSDRSSVMSSLLLYHLSFLRILAPIDELHHISYRVTNEKAADTETLNHVWTWSQSEQCRIAVRHACMIWNLLFAECERSPEAQARFTFMAVVGLHHAAVVIWTYAGTHEEQSDLNLGSNDDIEARVPIVKEQRQALMTMFVQLFNRISPAWAFRSSFSAAAVRLSGTTFPLQTG